MNKAFLIIAACFALHQGYSQAISPDSSFGKMGILQFGPALLNDLDEQGAYCFTQRDNKQLYILALGQYGNGGIVVTRRQPDGAIDSSYGVNGFAAPSGIAFSSAIIQQDGKLVITGGGASLIAVRYDTTGNLDMSFGQHGTVTSSLLKTCNAVAVQADGKLILGGTNYSGFSILRLTDRGTVDTSFGNGGAVNTLLQDYAMIRSLSVGQDGKIVAAGTRLYGSGYGLVVARYLATGVIDSSFHQTGVWLSDQSVDVEVKVIAIPAGKILISANSYGTGTRKGAGKLTRLNIDGAFDSSFNKQGFIDVVFADNDHSYDRLLSITVEEDGKIVALGNTANELDNPNMALAKWNIDGSPDLAFGIGGKSVIQTISYSTGRNNIVFTADGKLAFLASIFDYNEARPNFDCTAFRVNTNGSPDNSYGLNGQLKVFVPSGFLQLNSIGVQNDGKILYDASISLESTWTGIASKIAIGRVTSAGAIDAGYTPFQSGITPNQLVVQDGKLITRVFVPDTLNGSALTRLNPDGSIDKTFGVNGRSVVTKDVVLLNYPIVLQGDGKIIELRIRLRADITSDVSIARYTRDGIQDNTFGQEGVVTFNIGYVLQPTVLAVQKDKKILLGGINSDVTKYVNSRLFFMRFDDKGNSDPSFGAGGRIFFDSIPYNGVENLILQSDGKYLTGLSTFTGLVNTYTVARFNGNGTPDHDFGNKGTIEVGASKFALEDNQKIVTVGVKASGRSTGDLLLSRYLPDGRPDSTFGDGGTETTLVDPGISSVDIVKYFQRQLYVSGSRQQPVISGVLVRYNVPDYWAYCPDDRIVPTYPGYCAAIVDSINPALSPADYPSVLYQFSGATLGSGRGSASGKIFNKGVTYVKYTYEKDSSFYCSFRVSVEDREKPVINNLAVSRSFLYPADHSLQDVYIYNTTLDNCGATNTSVAITSNEPDSSQEPGDLSPDWEILDNNHVRLRAENSLNGNGRTYTIHVIVRDSSGNEATGTIDLNVPKIIDTTSSNLKVSVTPNPSAGDFAITLISDNKQDRIDLKLFDAYGVVIASSQGRQAGETIVYGASLKRGTYFLQVTQVNVRKFVQLLKL